MSLLSERKRETTAEELKSRRLFQNIVDISYLPQLLRTSDIAICEQMEALFQRRKVPCNQSVESAYEELSWWQTHRESQDKLLMAVYLRRIQK